MQIRTGWLAATSSFNVSKHHMDAPLLLVDPDAEFDYGAGKLTPRGLRRLLDMHRAGSPLEFNKASGIFTMLHREGAPLGLTALIVLLMPSAFLSDFFPTGLPSSIFIVSVMGAIAVGGEFWATWENRRTEALHRVLTTLAVEIPKAPWRDGDLADDENDALLRKVHDTVANLRMEFNQVWMNNYQGGGGAGIFHRVVKRADRKRFNAEADQLFYSMARAIDAKSPELVDAVVIRMNDLAERIFQKRQKHLPVLAAIEAPAPQRSIAELAREMGATSEPDHIEYDSTPVLAPYPHSKQG